MAYGAVPSSVSLFSDLGNFPNMLKPQTITPQLQALTLNHNSKLQVLTSSSTAQCEAARTVNSDPGCHERQTFEYHAEEP